jgi:type IV secretion system protein VirB10
VSSALPDDAPSSTPEPPAAIAGDRGPAWVKRGASIQAKVQNGLALAVVALLGGGFLAWYYSRVAAEPEPADRSRTEAAAQGEMKLPPLGPAPPRAQPATVEAPTLVDAQSEEAQALLAGAPMTDPAMTYGSPSSGYGATAPAPAPVDPVLQRRLDAPVLIRGMGTFRGPSSEVEGEPSTEAIDGVAQPGTGQGASAVVAGAGANTALAGMLQPTRTAAAVAGVMPDRRFLLSKGAFIDCTLETAIDSTLPGMTTCVLATDVWSADGSVVLMERGTKLVGETRGDVQQGQRRLFVLWSEARTPAGVVVELASPGTDALGRSGVTGDVDTHFAARFGAAILISLIDAGTAALIAAQSSGDSSVVIAPQGASDVVAEVLRQTVNIPPTIRVPQGERVQVLVARDVTFAAVYALAHR